MGYAERAGLLGADFELQRHQQKAWRNPDLGRKTWYTPIDPGYLGVLFRNIQLSRLLVAGCGQGTEARWMSLWYNQVVACDLNQGVLCQAIKMNDEADEPWASRAYYFAGDVLKLSVKSQFDAALMIGVGTSLIGHSLTDALGNIGCLTRKGGHLLLSDYLRLDGGVLPGMDTLAYHLNDERWERRYQRDLRAIGLFLGKPLGEIAHLMGTFVVKPRGLEEKDAMGLSAADVCEAVRGGNFERFAQHRTLSAFESNLTAGDFAIVNWCSFPVDKWFIQNGEWIFSPDDTLLGINILAQKR